ncbi:hypothetical protein QWJ34_03175 [Saccharibacillus sp. CPCC 101409]|uniref:hypothetical protein n=1 Tax=Saccharibacillus sp. CPCC 101409 TaxID=3058041 RepID=UPI002670F6E6|nr:hypothetical protein [Saccharibacillus sp. CPCC 101409]MDO3408759.1 hypothetical protein [Saccharibacillus sp. CPCC 101409]
MSKKHAAPEALHLERDKETAERKNGGGVGIALIAGLGLLVYLAVIGGFLFLAGTGLVTLLNWLLG